MSLAAAGDALVAGLGGTDGGGEVALGESAAERRRCRRGCKPARESSVGLLEPLLAAIAAIVLSDSAGCGHNRRCSFRATPVLETCIGLLASIEDHAHSDRQTLADFVAPIQAASQKSNPQSACEYRCASAVTHT